MTELNAHLENQLLADNIFDAGLLEITCRECGQVNSNKDMAFIFDHIDEGCCKDCAEIESIKTDWGIE